MVKLAKVMFMRVIAGEKRGFPLKSPKGLNTRPTSDKIKGAIFNSLANYVDFIDKKAIDCFAGTGALGIEFLSRGGSYCTFYELNSQSLNCIKDNLKKTDYENKSKVVKGNVITHLTKTSEKYHLFFVDPPYNQGLSQKVIDLVVAKDLLLKDGAIVIETDKKENLDIANHYFILANEKNYGDTKITILLRS